ncbi:MAG: hypothetical protein P4L27_05370 [Ignavibacteriaceae bacterium]|nr:hypothetical protein [Ignavibacteriaceae bacterium]
MKTFMITYTVKDKKPTLSGIMPSEWFDVISKEDVPYKLYKKLNLTKEEFEKKFKIVEIKEI